MYLIPFEKLYNTDFIITEPMAKTQFWYNRGSIYNSLDKPKISHTLLWFKNCSAVITDSLGHILHVKQNQLTYMAKGIKYKVDFFDTAPDREDTVVIHFQMTDINAKMMDNMAEDFKNNIVCNPELKASIYKILATISQHRKRKTAKNKYTCIDQGIKLLEQNSNMKINDIAKLCGVSECYFRKLFKEYSGESPVDFRQRYRIEKAKQLLLSDEGFTIGEIAEELNFTDIYHFSKTFKKYTDISPRQFVSLRN